MAMAPDSNRLQTLRLGQLLVFVANCGGLPAPPAAVSEAGSAESELVAYDTELPIDTAPQVYTPADAGSAADAPSQNGGASDDYASSDATGDEDLQEATMPPTVEFDPSGVIAAEIGGVPTSTCTAAPAEAPIADFQETWPSCFAKSWPSGIILPPVSTPYFWALPHQKSVVGRMSEKVFFPGFQWLRIADSKLQSTCELAAPKEAISASDGPVAKFRSLVAAGDRLFVGYDGNTSGAPSWIAEYDFDCGIHSIRKGAVDDIGSDWVGKLMRRADLK